MKYLAYVLLILTSGVVPAQSAPEELRITGPSIVALYTPDWEVTEQERNSEGFYDFLDDYQVYAGKVQAAFAESKNVKYIASYARKVSFKEPGVTPITSKALSGYGFIVYVPGKAPKIIRGVLTDVDILCTLKELDASIPVGVQCEPNNPLNGVGPDGPRH